MRRRRVLPYSGGLMTRHVARAMRGRAVIVLLSASLGSAAAGQPSRPATAVVGAPAAADSACGGGRPTAAVVLDVEGPWNLRRARMDAEPVQRERALCSGDTLVRRATNRPARVVVIARDGRRLERVCAAGSSCQTLPVANVKPQTVTDHAARFFAAIVDAFHEAPERFVVLASRGAGGGPREAVVALRGDSVDLGPALQGAGRSGFGGPVRAYAVVLTALDAASPGDTASGVSARPRPAEARGAWMGDSSRTSAVEPGLYLLSVRGANGSRVAADAWVLVSDSADYRTLASRFDEARALARAWGPAAQGRDARSALRAFLFDLARPPGRASRRDAR